ncbi:vacuolar ATP synthase subunit E [Sclerotinia borealis F-4128]|uniref:Vacuolar ATP synthase subunit E n=1 Tax=Sclerotinia borealis (strain F-4128) TaxID=1432307 RepID=W9C404_SCLBF|nr:vacuolar ATP synthase subunit E [Sclerotinia borealis F-4128]
MSHALSDDQEFAIEKSKLVRQETSSIDTQYEKKFKTARMSQQITQSTVANKTRLKVLSARQELLDGIFEQAQGKLKEATSDKGKYTEIMKNLLLEGMYALNEEKLQVRGRKQDYEVLKKAIEEAQKEYKEKTKKDVVASIDEKNPLPEDTAGGLSIIGGGGKIDINNTFEERLKLLQDNALPSVRNTLFGPNVNRKFYD